MRRVRTVVVASLCLSAALAVPLTAPAGAQRSWTVPQAVSMYRFPVADGQLFYEERTDRGQDFATRPGGPVLAIGRSVVMTNRGYFPGRTVVLQSSAPGSRCRSRAGSGRPATPVTWRSGSR